MQHPDKGLILDPPTAFANTYPRARAVDAAVADNYIRHTRVGDPELDRVMEELADFPTRDLHRFVQAGIEQEDKIKQAPKVLRDFFDNLDEPDWLDYDKFLPGMRALHSNTDDTIVAFLCGVLVEGFTTLIRKSFVVTSRVLLEPTQRRQKQNIRQLLEIFLPDGLKRYGDGYKLSLRVRIVHSRIRQLIAHSEDWDEEAWGVPVSAAHLGYAIAVFSVGLMEYSVRTGAKYSQEEKDSVVDVWRYAGYVMGIPESILYSTPQEAAHLRKIVLLAEPPMDEDSVTMAHGWLGSAPATGGVKEPKEAEELTALVFQISRALMGNKRANALKFPRDNMAILGGSGILFLYRFKQYLKKKFIGVQTVKLGNFSQFIAASAYDERLTYKLPDHVNQGKTSWW